jgi:hypothetical protein
MSNELELANQGIALAHTLKDVFRDQYEELATSELTTKFDFSTQISTFLWAYENLPVLSECLISIPSLLKLEINIDGCFKEAFLVRSSTSKLELEWSNPDLSKEIDYGSLPSNAIGTYEVLWNRLKGNSSSRFPFFDIFSLLEKLQQQGVNIILNLNLSIYKNRINENFMLNKKDCQNIVCFLFPESLLLELKSSSLETFENEFYKHGKRTVIIVFGFSGYLKGDYLSICGYDNLNNISNEIIEPLNNQILQKANKSLDLRQYHSSGTFPVEHLTPDVFSILIDKNENSSINEIIVQLNMYRAILSALFLANYGEATEGEYRIEFIGRGKASLTIKRSTLLDYGPQLYDLYQLYVYAYDSFSVDKLELARQFLSLSVDSVASLCKHAKRVREATKAAYDNVLIGKVGDYFDARQNIQDMIKTSTEETSARVISLSQDVSKDLYTIAGVIAVAISGILLKPDFGLHKAILAASFIIAAYMIVVILYHLNTLRQAYDLQIAQRKAYIQSFEEVLGRDEIDKYLGDKQLNDITLLFDNTLNTACLIYSVILAVSLVVALIII